MQHSRELLWEAGGVLMMELATLRARALQDPTNEDGPLPWAADASAFAARYLYWRRDVEVFLSKTASAGAPTDALR